MSSGLIKRVAANFPRLVKHTKYPDELYLLSTSMLVIAGTTFTSGILIGLCLDLPNITVKSIVVSSAHIFSPHEERGI